MTMTKHRMVVFDSSGIPLHQLQRWSFKESAGTFYNPSRFFSLVISMLRINASALFMGCFVLLQSFLLPLLQLGLCFRSPSDEVSDISLVLKTSHYITSTGSNWFQSCSWCQRHCHCTVFGTVKCKCLGCHWCQTLVPGCHRCRRCSRCRSCQGDLMTENQ